MLAEQRALEQRGDIDGLLACLTDDAVLVNPRGEVARGSAEIRRALGRFLTGEARGSHHRSVISRVEFVTDDVALVDGEAHLTEMQGVGEGASPAMSHGFTDVFVKRSETWAIAHVPDYARLR